MPQQHQTQSTEPWRYLPPADKQRYLERLKAKQVGSQANGPAARGATLAQYRNNPVGFVRDLIVWNGNDRPTAYQEEILEQLAVHRRVAVRGPHGLGKTALASWVVLWFALTRDGQDWKIPTTASAWRQLTKYLWPEIHKWSRRIRWDKVGRAPFNTRSEMLGLNLKLATGEAFAVASDTADLIEGAHADSLLYLFDEAKAIPGETFDAAEGAFSGAGSDTASEAYALAISTPGEPQGRFYDIHKRKPGYEDWFARHVTLEEAIEAGRISREWADQRKKQWGEGSAVYQNRVEGEFASSDEDGVIPLGWIEQANERWHALHDEEGNWQSLPPFKSVGVDVGRGGDQTVMALCFGDVITELRHDGKADTMQAVGKVKGILDKNGGSAVVDVIGIGAGVVDRLREMGCSVHAFNASEKTDKKDRSEELGFTNKRSAVLWHLRELLDPLNSPTLALPPDDLLTGDLTAPHWRVLSGGKIQIESKDDIKKRLGRSPDDGDAVSMAVAGGWLFSQKKLESEPLDSDLAQAMLNPTW